MKKLITLVISIAVSFNHCITNQQDACETKIAIHESDMNACTDSLIASRFFITSSKDPNAADNPNSLGNQWLNVALLKCLTALQNEKKCNQKSQYMPAFKVDGF